MNGTFRNKNLDKATERRRKRKRGQGTDRKRKGELPSDKGRMSARNERYFQSNFPDKGDRD